MSSDNTRDRLLRAAATEISRHGYRGASLRGVAARAEIRAASIFHFFPEGKEQLARTMLAHIMETIATRMTPTLGAGSSMPAVELIVQCAALLWDFMIDYPEYAGVLLREALEPDEAIAEVVGEAAQRVVKLATAYIKAAQDSGQLGQFNVRRFLMHLASYVITFHAAPTMRRHVLGARCSVREERAAFLSWVRREVQATKS
jgi:AcrR family transcriptional regulator